MPACPEPRVVDPFEPVEFVGTPSSAERLLVFTIHDGGRVPRALLDGPVAPFFDREDVRGAYLRERDWGADLVARHLAAELGLGGFFKVHLARVMLDYGRFPGSSEAGEHYLLRKSIYEPIESLLAPEQKHELISRYYDEISQAFTRHFEGKALSIAVHTYDPQNASGTDRPEVSLVTRSWEYQKRSTIPAYTFDPLFPAELCETVCDRSLTYRTLLDLENSGRHVALNYPYFMPNGSLEIRAQALFFFRYLQRRFSETFPETTTQEPYNQVWQMLFDVTRRSSESQTLRGYLHRYRDAPPGLEAAFSEARCAYGEIRRFLALQDRLVPEYRFSEARPSSLGIEVRKDLLFDLDHDRLKARPRPDAEQTARDIARLVAGSVRSHMNAASASLGAWQPAVTPT